MKKSTLLLLGIISILTSCSVTKKIKTEPVMLNQEKVQVNITVILPGQVDTTPINVDDTNLYNTYFLTYKNGQTQTLQYEYLYNFYGVIDSSKVSTVDTLQYKVLWKDLN